MGVTKTILKEGTGPIPKPGDTVEIEYTGWLLKKPEENQVLDKAKQIEDLDKAKQIEDSKKTKPFDSSVGRGVFVVQIGVGQVIKGWDEGVTTMKVGEKADLEISSDFAYADRGFPPVIPPKSALLFEVELQAIN